MAHLDYLNDLVDLTGRNVADIGAGSGEFAALMSAAGAKVTGIEIDDAKVERARSLHGEHASFLRGTGEALPLADGSAELVTFMFSMHHIPSALQQGAVEEALRCLGPKGRIHVVEPHISGPMTEVVAHVDDETHVRNMAQKFLNALETSAPVKLVAKTDYDVEETYVDFDAIVKSVVMVDEARATWLSSVGADMKQTFLRVSKRTDQGYVFMQPCIMHHFEKL